jgi:hypothetical protein
MNFNSLINLLGFALTLIPLDADCFQYKREIHIPEKRPLSLNFGDNSKLSDSLFFHYFCPVDNMAVAYEDYGTGYAIKVLLTPSDTILVNSIERGNFDGHSGNWIPIFQNNGARYILLDKHLHEVTEQKHQAIQASEAVKVRDGRHTLWKALAGFLPFLILSIYAYRIAPHRVKPPWVHIE